MKNLRWAIVVLLALSIQRAYADSFNISRVTISFAANTSSGDNSQFTFSGPGTSIVGGGSACYPSDGWCSGALLPPGSSVTPNVGLVSFEGLSIFKLGGHSYDMSQGTFSGSSITAGASFTLPMGKNSPITFTVTVPANLNPPVGGILPDGSHFNLNIPPGKLVLTFG